MEKQQPRNSSPFVSPWSSIKRDVKERPSSTTISATRPNSCLKERVNKELNLPRPKVPVTELMLKTVKTHSYLDSLLVKNIDQPDISLTSFSQERSLYTERGSQVYSRTSRMRGFDGDSQFQSLESNRHSISPREMVSR
jgi:hypothetical protein